MLTNQPSNLVVVVVILLLLLSFSIRLHRACLPKMDCPPGSEKEMAFLALMTIDKEDYDKIRQGLFCLGTSRY